MWGADVKIHAFLTKALDEGEWLVSRPRRFNPRGKGAHWIGR